MSAIPKVEFACETCHRGYIASKIRKCIFPGCDGIARPIEPVENNFSYSKTWEPMPPHLIKWMCEVILK